MSTDDVLENSESRDQQFHGTHISRQKVCGLLIVVCYVF